MQNGASECAKAICSFPIYHLTFQVSCCARSARGYLLQMDIERREKIAAGLDMSAVEHIINREFDIERDKQQVKG